MNEEIKVLGARVHNLQNIDVTIPRNSLVVITGLSGSGKSSLAFDTIYAEGQRRYMETLSAYARQFLGGMERPDVDKITGLSPVYLSDQKQKIKTHVQPLEQLLKFTIFSGFSMPGHQWHIHTPPEKKWLNTPIPKYLNLLKTASQGKRFFFLHL